MKYFFSKSKNGFFIEGVSSVIPEDSLELTEQNYHELLEGQAEGKQIVVNEQGYPDLSTTYNFPIEILLQSIRDQRNNLLKESDWTQLPDIPESIKNSWSNYRQQLRDIPQQPGFPQNVVWPEKPS